MRSILSIALLLFAGITMCHAQVIIDRSIELTGSDAEQRQVHGVPAVDAPDALLNVEMELSGQHRYAEPATGPLWQVDLPALDQSPVAGTQILVRAPQPTAGPLQVMIGQHGPYPITRGSSQPLQGDEVPEGTILSLVFDGSAMQMISGVGHSLRGCPEGMVAVNDQYCIQIQRTPATATFWEAIEACGAIGQRLCSWGEYFAACNSASNHGITDMPGVWEWTNNTANEDMSVRIVGVPSCWGAGTSSPEPNLANFPRYYRCCFTR